MTSELIVLLGDDVVGRLRRSSSGRLAFVYDEAWRGSPVAYPLSVSMPLAAPHYGHAAVDPYLWGLLPDNELILERWSKRFHVSARSAFGLLSHVGEDCPGAVRFVRPDRAGAVARGEDGEIAWLDEREIAERLRALGRDVSAWRREADEGQFSLGGAQAKTALYRERGTGRWGLPRGRIPTTHILKPGLAELDGHAQNEHVCLLLAREVGLPVASSWIERFEDEVAIVIERYDRVEHEGVVLRVHQEDCCQALGVAPVHKYENEGGPGARSTAALLRTHSAKADEDVMTFVDALGFNWLVAGTDAHAKNYSLLIGAAGRVRLAPLYDVASFLPYARHGTKKVKLAMKIGGKYRLHEIGVDEWNKLAKELGLDADVLRSRLAATCRALPDLTSAVTARAEADGLSHSVVQVLAREIQARAKTCAKILA